MANHPTGTAQLPTDLQEAGRRTPAYLSPSLGFPQRGEREECHWWPGPSLPTSSVSCIPHGKTGWGTHHSHGGSTSHTRMSLMPWRWLDGLVPLELQGAQKDIRTGNTFLLPCLEDPVSYKYVGEGLPALHPPACS